jgi:hypothetical protein
MNNVLSLCKNIFYRLKNPLKILYILFCAFTFILIIYLLFVNNGVLKKRIGLSSVSCVIFLIPFFIKLVKFTQKKFLFPLETNGRQRDFLFLAGAAALAILAGIAIPASVIVSSPDEFSFIDSYTSPLPFIFNTLFKSAGLFLFWPTCVYFLFGNPAKSLFALLFSVLPLYALVNCFVFAGNSSTITNIFVFESLSGLTTTAAHSVVNIFCGMAILAVCLLVLRAGKINFVYSVMGIIFVSLACFSTYNIFAIQKRFMELVELKKTNGEVKSVNPVFSLSKDNPNLIIIMSDRAINGYVRPIFEEHPELNEEFDGFTLFPNTLSFSLHTIMGAPPIFGGYEYTPQEINARNSIPLVEKCNEALLLIPTILTGKGYQVTVTDPPYAGHALTPDPTIYNQLDNVKAFNTVGRYTALWCALNNWTQKPFTSIRINRNTLWFSFLKIAPPFLRELIYDDERYWENDAYKDSMKTFLDSYAVLDFLPQLTKYDAAQPQAVLFTNDLTHDGSMLQVPEYKPVEHVTNTGNGEFSASGLYHTNNAFYLKIGAWFDELKKNGVYDNTRIIIVSDHGAGVDAKIDDTDIAIQDERRENYNPVLLYKDFNEHGKLKTDNTFMTNADVPVLALNGIADLVNPFTGKLLTENPKENGVNITISHVIFPYEHGKTTFKIKDNQWMFVMDSIFDGGNGVKQV